MYNKLVSCVIPSYKRADTLRRAINSALAQTYTNIEILVVDDNIAGDDYSIALHDIIGDYNGDNRVILVTQPKHINGAEARNAGVRASHGDYIAFLDDDDEWWPTKIAKQVKFLEENSEYDGIAGGATNWDEKKGEVSKWPRNKITEDNLLFKVMIRDVGFGTSTFLCRKNAFIEMGGFDNKLKRSQDLQLFTDFLSKFRIYPIWDERTTKMYVESAMNRLNAEQLAKNKDEYFSSVSSVMQTLPRSTQRRIKSAHYYEVAYIALKEKKYAFAIRYMFKGLCSPSSIIDLLKRYSNR